MCSISHIWLSLIRKIIVLILVWVKCVKETRNTCGNPPLNRQGVALTTILDLYLYCSSLPPKTAWIQAHRWYSSWILFVYMTLCPDDVGKLLLVHSVNTSFSHYAHWILWRAGCFSGITCGAWLDWPSAHAHANIHPHRVRLVGYMVLRSCGFTWGRGSRQAQWSYVSFILPGCLHASLQ